MIGIKARSASPPIDSLAVEIISRAILPVDAIIDALNIACAAIHRVDYLLTWKWTHIANPMILPKVFRVLVICPPQDMLDSYSNVRAIEQAFGKDRQRDKVLKWSRNTKEFNYD